MIPSIYPFNTRLSILNSEKKKWIRTRPKGVTIHDAADRDVSRVISWLNQKNLGYHFIIDRDGSIIQTFYLDSRIDHSGNAKWNDLSPNRHHISICLMSWGKLIHNKDKFYAWNGDRIEESEVVKRPNLIGLNGMYDPATKEQEKSLMSLLSWIVSFDIDPSNICGHDECCIPEGRKQDPGGVLSLSTEAIRVFLSGDKTWDKS